MNRSSGYGWSCRARQRVAARARPSARPTPNRRPSAVAITAAVSGPKFGLANEPAKWRQVGLRSCRCLSDEVNGASHQRTARQRDEPTRPARTPPPSRQRRRTAGGRAVRPTRPRRATSRCCSPVPPRRQSRALRGRHQYRCSPPRAPQDSSVRATAPLSRQLRRQGRAANHRERAARSHNRLGYRQPRTNAGAAGSAAAPLR